LEILIGVRWSQGLTCLGHYETDVYYLAHNDELGRRP